MTSFGINELTGGVATLHFYDILICLKWKKVFEFPHQAIYLLIF